jgi:xylose isomerase
VRRQSLDAEDLILAHVGAMDCCARGLKVAARMIEDGAGARARERYAGWDRADILGSDLATLAERVEREGIDPQPRSGRQERLENLVEPVSVAGRASLLSFPPPRRGSDGTAARGSSDG